MAKFQLVYEDENDIPEGLRDFYVEEDGKFKFDAEYDDYSELKNAIKTERELRQKAEARAKGRSGGDKGGSGITSKEREELEELRREREQKEEEDLRRKGEYEKLEKRLHDDYAKKLEAKDSEASKYKKSLHKVLIENEATKAIAKHKGRVTPLLPHVSNKLSVVEDEDGTFSVKVVDGGDVRYSSKDPKSPMSVAELIESDFLTNDEFQGIFEGRGHSGGGTPHGAGRGTGGAITLTREQAKDSRVYRQAQEQASKAGRGRVQVVNE